MTPGKAPGTAQEAAFQPLSVSGFAPKPSESVGHRGQLQPELLGERDILLPLAEAVEDKLLTSQLQGVAQLFFISNITSSKQDWQMRPMNL